MRHLNTRTLIVGLVLVALVAVVAQTAAWAQAEDGGEAATPPADEGGYLPAETGGSTLSVLDVLWKLALAALLAWGVVHGIRWWRDAQFSAAGDAGRGGRRMWVEETLSLGSDGRLYLVEVEGRRMLLAAQEGSLAQIADVDEKPGPPSAYRSVRKRADGSTDELNVRRADVSTRAVRPDVVDEDTESWEERRGRLLRELQERG